MKTGLYETLERIAATIEARRGGDPLALGQHATT